MGCVLPLEWANQAQGGGSARGVVCVTAAVDGEGATFCARARTGIRVSFLDASGGRSSHETKR
eukprot:603997-Prymnesium_polylepis.1